MSVIEEIRLRHLGLPRVAAALAAITLAALSAPHASGQVGGSLVVTITSPTGGSTVGGTIPVNATVTVIGSLTVQGVQFKLDGANLGPEDTSDPYSVSWDTRTATNTSHTLTAVARDALGVLWTSDPVVVTVFNDKTPPVVALTAPSAGAALKASVAVSANATDNVGVVGVQFKLDGADLGAEDTTSPYSLSWDTRTAGDGSHSLAAVARDAAGNATTSVSVAVTVDNTAPMIAITSPGSGADVAGITTVGADATDAVGVVGVQFKLDGANRGAESTASPFRLSWDTRTATEGSHTLISVARDAAGNTTTSTAVTVTVDNTLPTVAITAPASGASVAGTTILSAAASDNRAVTGVQFILDGAVLGAEVTTAPFTMAWDTTAVASGPHTLTAMARDGAGNMGRSGAVTVMVSQTATRFENTDYLSIVYTEGIIGANGQSKAWWHGSRSRDWSGGVASFTRGEGSRATFTFTGTTVRWIGFRAPWAGIARVYLDDVFMGELDLYQPTEEEQAVVFARTGLAAGTHELVVESTGRKDPSAVDYAVVVDAFDVAPASQARVTGTRVEEQAMTFTDGWSQDPAGIRAWSGGTAELSTTVGAQATYSFIGTEVRWIGLRGPQNGIARVYLDGSFHAQVDTYSPVEVDTVVFTALNLAPGRHTMTVEVTGDKNAASAGTAIAVDALDVRTRFEETDKAVTYTAGWRDGFMDAAYSGTSTNRTGLAFTSDAAGAQAAFTFTGTSVKWIGARGPAFGIARVLLDGVFVTEVDAFAPASSDIDIVEPQAELFTAGGLTDGVHTLTIEVAGRNNTASTGFWIVVDAFEAGLSPSAPTITRFQEIDASAAYSSSWNGMGYRLFAGEGVTWSQTAGAQATFTFNGTAVRWIGLYAFNGGIARVSLDGVQVAEIDTYAPVQEEFQAEMFRAMDLAAGTDTLTIEVAGQANALSQGTSVFVDAFDVH